MLFFDVWFILYIKCNPEKSATFLGCYGWIEHILLANATLFDLERSLIRW